MSNITNLFKAPVPSSTATTVNHEGYPAWKRSLEEQYLQMLLTNTLSNTFYVKQGDLLKESNELHDKMVATDPAYMAKALVYARNKGFMRSQTILGLFKLSSLKERFFEQVFEEIIRTPNDLSDFFSIVRSVRGGEGGRRIKRVAGNWILKNLTEYWAIKYGSDRGNGGYSLADMIRTTHPKCEHNAIIAYLLGKNPKTGLPQIDCFEALKYAKSDTDKVALITTGRLPHEVATTFAGGSKAVWKAIVPQMPIFALLKNLATIERQGVMNDVRDVVVATFQNKDKVRNSKILPFRFIDAMEHVRDGKVKDALRDALEISFESIPDFEGNTGVLLDVSPSMFHTPNLMKTASVLATSIMKKTGGNGELVLFGNTAQVHHISMRDSLLTQAETLARIQIPGTNQGIAIQTLLNARKSVDNLIIITDGEQNSGRPFMDVLADYKRIVNKNVRTFIVDVSPYGHAITATQERNTYYIYGWNDQVLNYINLASKGFGGIVDAIKNGVAVNNE